MTATTGFLTLPLEALERSLHAAYNTLKVPHNNPVSLRRLAENTITHHVRNDILKSIFLDLDEVQEQAGRVSKHFLYMYGTRLWNIGDPVAIELADELQRDMKSYFVCLLQIPLEVPESEWLGAIIRPELTNKADGAVVEDNIDEASDSPDGTKKEQETNTEDFTTGETNQAKPEDDDLSLNEERHKAVAEVERLRRALAVIAMAEAGSRTGIETETTSPDKKAIGEEDLIWDGEDSPERIADKIKCELGCDKVFNKWHEAQAHYDKDHRE